MDKQEILNRLDIKSYYLSHYPKLKINGEWGQTHCNFDNHKDDKPSLFVNLINGTYHCKGCGVKGSLFDFYMKKHGVDYRTAFNALAKEAGLTTEPQKKIVKVYDYVDESGNLLSQTVRYKPKDFSQRRPDPNNKGKWLWNLEGIQLAPYNLPEVLKAKSIVIAEGEEDCDNLKALGFTATCNPMGAGKWEIRDKITGEILRPYNNYFKGKRIVIIPDNDKPGRDHAQDIAKNLKSIAESLKVVELPNLKEKEDVSDWIALGHSKEELIELIKQTPEWIPEEPKSLLDSLLKWNDILFLNIKTEYLLEKLIPQGSITLLFGRGGIGKTSISLQIAYAIAEGKPFGDFRTIKTPVYFIDFENPLAVLKERVEKIGESDNLWVWHISNPTLPPRLDSREWELYKDLPAGLLIVDTLRASHLSDENDSKPMALIMARLKELREIGFTILLLHHTPKSNENIFKGSTALLDLADHVLGLEEVRESDTIEFDIGNLYRLGARLKTRYDPHHIFLIFNPNIKGFEIAKDPDLEKMKDIQEILIQSQKTPNQTEFRKMIRDELDYSDREARRLIKKGEDIYWQKELKKEGKSSKAFCYVQMSDIYIGDKWTQQNNTLSDSDMTTPENQMQTLDNSHLSICQDTPQQMDTTTNDEVIDLEHEEVEIVE
jgi:archaellum biogenesis ATPase FlaH/5S rRNA maturation endonuclease (ribonuclease M5)